MIGNWIRVFILLLIAYYEGVSHPLMEDHDTLGWIVFGAVMLPWFFIDRHFDAEGEQESPVKQDTSQPLKQQILSLTACTVLLIISQLALSPPENREYQVSQPKLPKTLNGLTLDLHVQHRLVRTTRRQQPQRHPKFLYQRSFFPPIIRSSRDGLVGSLNLNAISVHHIFS